jgi:hypothetical protein
MLTNPEETYIAMEEIRTWCIREVRDMPQEMLVELSHVIRQLKEEYKPPRKIEGKTPPRRIQ